jgi:hypothetical protein
MVSDEGNLIEMDGWMVDDVGGTRWRAGWSVARSTVIRKITVY